jgi:Skp family chaperone for outer membrane proteins
MEKQLLREAGIRLPLMRTIDSFCLMICRMSGHFSSYDIVDSDECLLTLQRILQNSEKKSFDPLKLMKKYETRERKSSEHQKMTEEEKKWIEELEKELEERKQIPIWKLIHRATDLVQSSDLLTQQFKDYYFLVDEFQVKFQSHSSFFF